MLLAAADGLLEGVGFVLVAGDEAFAVPERPAVSLFSACVLACTGLMSSSLFVGEASADLLAGLSFPDESDNTLPPAERLGPVRLVGASDWRPERGLEAVGLVVLGAPEDVTDEGRLFEGSGATGGPMDDLAPPTGGRVAEDSFLAVAPDGVPVREVDVEEAAVATLGLTGLVGDFKKVRC